jgi:hypothetical protein
MSMVRHVLAVASTLMLLLSASSATSAQSATAAPGTTYRVFLTTGEPLPSYGEPVLVGDRVIFNLLVGAPDGVADVQLVSLPASEVDSARTMRYAQAMRASHYGSTRGEADYAALTAEVARVLDQLTAITDARRRLLLAEDARRQVLAWSEQHYQYRAEDIRELALLFDDVIAELRIAAGEPSVSFELVARPVPLEPLLPAPTVRESVALALTAARVADIGAERVDILKKASDAAERVDDGAVHQTVSEALAEEVKAGTAYASLISAMRVRSDEARRRGDVAAVERLTRELERQDRQLGQRRPAEVRDFNSHLAATLEATRAFRAAVDAHARQLSGLQRYDQGVRPLLDRFDDLAPLLSALREMRGVSQAQVSSGEAAILRLGHDLDQVRPPLAQAGVHASFQNVLRIAREAFVRRRQARASQSAEMREASAAAAGALLLVGQVRLDLAASLRRPTIQ